MFDDLRATNSPEPARPRSLAAFSPGKALGISPSQLFILSVVLFVNVSLMGCLALIVFEKIDLLKLF